MHPSISDDFIMITIRCRQENVSLERLHLFMHTKEDQPANQCTSMPLHWAILTNYILMQQCTPNRTAVCCSSCLKDNIWAAFHLLLKTHIFLQQTGTQIPGGAVQLVPWRVPSFPFPQREKLTDKETYPVTDSQSDRLWCYTPHPQVSTYVLIPADWQKINDQQTGWGDQGTAHNVQNAVWKS